MKAWLDSAKNARPAAAAAAPVAAPVAAPAAAAPSPAPRFGVLPDNPLQATMSSQDTYTATQEMPLVSMSKEQGQGVEVGLTYCYGMLDDSKTGVVKGAKYYILRHLLKNSAGYGAMTKLLVVRAMSIPPTKSGNVGTVISNLELLWLKYDQLSAPKVDTLHVDEGKQKQIAWTDYTSIIISTEQRCARVVDANATQATGGGTRLDGLMGCSETEARLIAIAIVVVLIRVWKGERRCNLQKTRAKFEAHFKPEQVKKVREKAREKMLEEHDKTKEEHFEELQRQHPHCTVASLTRLAEELARQTSRYGKSLDTMDKRNALVHVASGLFADALNTLSLAYAEIGDYANEIQYVQPQPSHAAASRKLMFILEPFVKMMETVKGTISAKFEGKVAGRLLKDVSDLVGILSRANVELRVLDNIEGLDEEEEGGERFVVTVYDAVKDMEGGYVLLHEKVLSVYIVSEAHVVSHYKAVASGKKSAFAAAAVLKVSPSCHAHFQSKEGLQQLAKAMHEQLILEDDIARKTAVFQLRSMLKSAVLDVHAAAGNDTFSVIVAGINHSPAQDAVVSKLHETWVRYENVPLPKHRDGACQCDTPEEQTRHQLHHVEPALLAELMILIPNSRDRVGASCVMACTLTPCSTCLVVLPKLCMMWGINLTLITPAGGKSVAGIYKTYHMDPSRGMYNRDTIHVRTVPAAAAAASSSSAGATSSSAAGAATA